MNTISMNGQTMAMDGQKVYNAFSPQKGEAKVSEMPIEYAPQFTKKYNKTICDQLGITVPADYVAIEQ